MALSSVCSTLVRHLLRLLLIHLHSPIINRLVGSKEHKVEALKHITLLNLPAEEEGHGIVEGRQHRLEHELVARRQRADDVEVQVGRCARED